MSTRAKEIVTELASSPRFAGSAEEQTARTLCRDLLEKAGFSVADQHFEFSEAPARWGPSLIASVAALIVLTSAHLATRHDVPWTGFLIQVVGLAALSLVGYCLGRFGILPLRMSKSSATNLIATRLELDAPKVWLVAHVDSKSQTIPMILRVASAVAFSTASAVVLLGILLTAAFGSREILSELIVVFSYIAAVTAFPIILCFIGNKSPGALDNATGVAAIILAAEKLRPSQNVGVLITSGEELGLAGARWFVSTQTERGIAINCDTIDDPGEFLCMASGRKSNRLDAAIGAAAGRLDAETTGVSGRARRARLRLRGMIPGIIADNVPFTDAGWESFTLSRGNIATLGYVHTPRDLPDRIQGTGIAKAASLIAAIVEELG